MGYSFHCNVNFLDSVYYNFGVPFPGTVSTLNLGPGDRGLGPGIGSVNSPIYLGTPNLLSFDQFISRLEIDLG